MYHYNQYSLLIVFLKIIFQLAFIWPQKKQNIHNIQYIYNKIYNIYIIKYNRFINIIYIYNRFINIIYIYNRFINIIKYIQNDLISSTIQIDFYLKYEKKNIF